MKIRRRWRYSKPVLPGLVLISTLLAAAAAVQSYHDTKDHVGVDLANRITGARVLMAGHNPYKERPVLDATGAPLKPMQFVPGWVENPYPPTLLTVYGLFSSLRYPAQRAIWFGLEWGCLIVSLLLLVRSLQRTNERLILLSVGLLCFACGYFWRLHVERGQ